jgi:hypothetical protein
LGYPPGDEMINFPNPLADPPTVGALFVQPSYECAKHCPDCYVMAHKRDDHPDMEAWHHISLMGYFRLAGANQITLSMNDFPDNRLAPDFQRGSAYVMNFGHPDDWLEGRAELHLTVKSLDTLIRYGYSRFDYKVWDVVNISSFAYPFSGFHLDLLAELRQAGIHINWNHMFPVRDPTKEGMLLNYVITFTKMLSHVDSAYLIIRKSPVGKARDLETAERDTRNLRRDLKYLEALEEYLSSNERKKINIDGCLQCVRGFKEDGFGCSAGISTFHVWPDGSVTGCPYAYDSPTGPANDTPEVIENIRQVYRAYKDGKYDFNRCHLPQVYGNVLRQAGT